MWPTPSRGERFLTLSDPTRYGSIDAVWKERLGASKKENKEKWYKKAEDYWTTQAANVDGMLGGYAHVSNDDEKTSIAYIKELKLDQEGVVSHHRDPLRHS